MKWHCWATLKFFNLQVTFEDRCPLLFWNQKSRPIQKFRKKPLVFQDIDPNFKTVSENSGQWTPCGKFFQYPRASRDNFKGPLMIDVWQIYYAGRWQLLQCIGVEVISPTFIYAFKDIVGVEGAHRRRLVLLGNRVGFCADLLRLPVSVCSSTDFRTFPSWLRTSSRTVSLCKSFIFCNSLVATWMQAVLLSESGGSGGWVKIFTASSTSSQ